MAVNSRYPTVAPWPGPDDGDEGRSERGWHIAASTPFVKVRGGWITPSQSDPSVRYHLAVDEDGAYCSCPDQATCCKHIRGLEIVLERDRQAKEILECQPETKRIDNPAPAVQRESATPPISDERAAPPVPAAPSQADRAEINIDVPTRNVRNRPSRKSPAPARGQISPATEGRKRPTYQQDWSAYTAAQRNEKAHFRSLLKDLVVLVDDPEHQKGRRPYSRGDQIFSLVYKIYTGFSWRRFDTDLREAKANGFIVDAASPSSLARYMDDETLTPILHDLVLCSALPMAPFERRFAIDATGYSSSLFARWFTAKWGKVTETKMRDWAKLHLICGTDTNIITAAEVSDRVDHDNRFFVPLVDRTSEHFDMGSIAADMAYSSRKNYSYMDGLGSLLLAPFKSNTVRPPAGDNSPWARMYHRFMSDHEEWARHYHQRSNVEAVFSTMKRLFGDSLDSRNIVAQANEILCRVLAHNLIVIIHAMYERSLEPKFHLP